MRFAIVASALLWAAIFAAVPLFAQDAYSTLISPPVPADIAPAAPGDAAAIGSTTNMYALANHVHPSKARKGRVLIPISGVLALTFSTPFTSAPLCAVTAEATAGDTNVVNAQIDGVTTTTGMAIRITRTQQSVVALLGLTILSVPTQIATYTHYICIEP